MKDIDKKLARQRKILYSLLVSVVIIGIANFCIAFVRPEQITQTLLGPIGPKGTDGQKGDIGPTGPSGSNGIGLPGANGKDGKDGTNGTNGLNGANGKDGTNGTNGRTPEIACIADHVSWKYTGDTVWIPLYAAPCNVTPQGTTD